MKPNRKKSKHYLTHTEFMAMFKWYMTYDSFDGYVASKIFKEWELFFSDFLFADLVQLENDNRPSYGHFYQYIVDQFFQMADEAYAQQYQNGDENEPDQQSNYI